MFTSGAPSIYAAVNTTLLVFLIGLVSYACLLFGRIERNINFMKMALFITSKDKHTESADILEVTKNVR